jgi:glutaminyl-tRNA synthetase
LIYWNEGKKMSDANFIESIINEDIKNNKNEGRVHTRFPPEPNGYLHIGHAKSICLNFELAEKYNGLCNLRFDDTNPDAEDEEYERAIIEDVKWLGFDWDDRLFYSSDYFDRLYDLAVVLIKKGKAYVCGLTPEETKSYRGSLTEPGTDSPFRSTSVEDNLALFEQMKSGDFEEGKYVLRAKIDMASSNMNMRDPIIYRIKKAHHPRAKDKWCIYPMYDFTHGQSDSFEAITHSVCTLEFEDHRPLYDWLVQELELEHRPQQIEFARLNLEYTVMSKRKLIQLVTEKHVHGWDDPRLSTLKGMRRRGFSPKAIRNFSRSLGVTKKNSMISLGTLEAHVREDLDETAGRIMTVLDPIKVTITNFEEDSVIVTPKIHPKDEERGRREFSFTKNILIDREDFMEDPPAKFFRLGPDRKVRLKYGYVIHCDEVIKDASGKVVELKCTYDKDTFGGKRPEGQKKVKGIVHWVPAESAEKVEVRMYNPLFTEPNPLAMEKDFLEYINPQSMTVIKEAFIEPSLSAAKVGQSFQFERLGYFTIDSDSTEGNWVFNQTVTLKDAWAKLK